MGASKAGFLVRGTTPNGGFDGGRVKGSTSNGRRDHKCPSARRLHMVREDTGALNEGATCAWPMEQLAVRMHFLRCGGLLDDWSEPGLPVNDISRIHWPQHLLTTQLERPN
ncbi:uncharacterized protein TNCV_3205381 [Trichonephila clavipes]|nr:uncharacterized protein TNCV_3205381 [Trichonephila clavipes]